MRIINHYNALTELRAVTSALTMTDGVEDRIQAACVRLCKAMSLLRYMQCAARRRAPN